MPMRIWAGFLAVLLLGTGGNVFSANSLNELRGLKTLDSRIPVYNQNEQLQFLLYCAECIQEGRKMTANGPILDIIRKDADVDTIDTGRNTRIYPLGAPFEKVVEFWSGHLFSEGVAVSNKADIDQETQQAAGSSRVFFRSPLLDLDGIGFDADYKKQQIFVRKDVKMILRTPNSSPLKYNRGEPLPEQIESVRATADTLLIDLLSREIILSGHVHVQENRGTVDCGKMRIFLPENQKDSDIQSSDEFSIKGVSRILCENNVRIVREGTEEKQVAFAEILDYDLPENLIKLTGTPDRVPVMKQGENSLKAQVMTLNRATEALHAEGDCVLEYVKSAQKQEGNAKIYADKMDFDNHSDKGTLTGNVKIRDSRMDMDCGRMEIELAQKKSAPEKTSSDAESLEILGMTDFAPGAQRELRRIRCFGQVRMVQKQSSQTASAPAQSSVITADEGDFRQAENLVIFTNHVQVRDPRMALDCRQMDIHLKDAQQDPAKPSVQEEKLQESAGPFDMFNTSNASRQLDKIICTGEVKARESRMKMDCDKLTLCFRKTDSAATNPVPGMFQSNGMELTRILTDGHVIMESIPKQAAAQTEKTSSGASGDVKNAVSQFDMNTLKKLRADSGVVDIPTGISEFHGQVNLYEEQGSLDCEDLYLYTSPSGSGKGEKTEETRTANLDDDPFAQVEPTQVPQVISLGDERQLDRVVAVKNVVLVRKQPDGKILQKATGQKIEYFVARREIHLTGEPPEYARIYDVNPQNNGRGKKITVFLDRESVQFDEGVQMEFDQKGSPTENGAALPF